VDLENTLEQEQEMLVNKLWKRIEKVRYEREKGRRRPRFNELEETNKFSVTIVGGEISELSIPTFGHNWP